MVDSNNIKKIVGISIIIVMIITLMFRINQTNNINEVLKKTKETKAIIVELKKGGVKSTAGCMFIYHVDRKEYTYFQNGKYDFLKIGDTVLVEYSISDNSIAKIKNKYYMNKYRYLEEKNR